jgi:signal transduction histidine kinase/CheY-like chemotaxis protein
MRTVHQSLRRKVTLLVLAITVSALAMSAAGLVIYDLQAYERQSSADLTSQAEVLARSAAPALSFGDRPAAEMDLAVMAVRPRVLAAALYGRDGKLFATYGKSNGPPQAFPEAPGADGYAIDGGELSVYRRVIENGEMVGTVFLRATYEPWGRLKDYLTILFLVMIASLVVATLLSGWLQNAITAPILEVAQVSREVMDKRDYSLRARKTTEDEIGELVDAFNAMLAEVGRRSEAMREADRRKDEFLATLAHELRNPLAPIRNALEIIKIAGDDPVKSRMAREMMQRQVGQMVRLVDDLLDVSRITTGKLAVRKSVFDLHGAIHDAVETARPFIESRGQELQLDIARTPIAVEGDRTRLAQVFSNLLNNAAKYTETQGRIRLAVRQEGDDAVVSVSDNGIGLTPEAMGRIFEMFVQVDRTLERSQAGLGVGLTLARRLVELHNGTLEARSEGPGKGSEFTVRIPVSGLHLDQAASATPADDGEVHARRILLADDNVDFANSLGQLLSAQGHEVRIAYDGASALQTARDFNPQIAFVDIGMPKVHGYEVARRLRADAGTAGCVLVAVTGWGQENDRKRAREAGFDRHLVKPVDPTEIESILENY